MLFNTLFCFVLSSIFPWYFKARPWKYTVKTMVFEGFSNFYVWENYFPNGPILPPKLAPKSSKNPKKSCSERIVFWCRFFIYFGWIWEPKIIPKWVPGHPQLSPRHSRSASWTRPKPKRLPKLNVWWFRLDFGWILEGYCSRAKSSKSKTNSVFEISYFQLKSLFHVLPPHQES